MNVLLKGLIFLSPITRRYYFLLWDPVPERGLTGYKKKTGNYIDFAFITAAKNSWKVKVKGHIVAFSKTWFMQIENVVLMSNSVIWLLNTICAFHTNGKTLFLFFFAIFLNITIFSVFFTNQKCKDCSNIDNIILASEIAS